MFSFASQILNEIAQHKIKIYEFPEVEEEEESKLHKVLRDRVPFAVVGANTVVEHDGRKVRGRKYPWGIAEGEIGFFRFCFFILSITMLLFGKINFLGRSWMVGFFRIVIFFNDRYLFAVENLEHCDFIALRNMVIRTHLQDLKDVTNNVHYENFRCRTLAGLGVDGKPTRISNK